MNARRLSPSLTAPALLLVGALLAAHAVVAKDPAKVGGAPAAGRSSGFSGAIVTFRSEHLLAPQSPSGQRPAPASMPVLSRPATFETKLESSVPETLLESVRSPVREEAPLRERRPAVPPPAGPRRS